jgi:hypothetical protein
MHMKRIALVTALLGALVLAFAGVAMADTSTPGNSSIGGASGNGAAVTHYTAAYADPLYGPVSCAGVHQVKKGKPTQESFTCTSTSGSPLTNLSPGGTVTAPWGWYSDDDGAFTTNITGTVSADGMSYSAIATY